MRRNLTIFTARKVITMDPGLPVADAVAVADGRIVEVGSMASMRPWLDVHDHVIDDRFSGSVIMPGLIDPHLHPVMAAVLLAYGIVAPESWDLPGDHIPACPNREAVFERIATLARGPANGEPLLLWGTHEAWHGVITRADLDAACPDRPVVLRDRSFHVLILNSAAISWLGLQRPAPPPAEEQINWETGVFSENGMWYALEALMPYLSAPDRIDRGIELVKNLVHRGGVTTCADLAAGAFLGPDGEWDVLRRNLDADDTPFRTYLVPVPKNWENLYRETPEEILSRITSLPANDTPRLQWLKAIKTFGDGAFVTQHMKLCEPGFIDGHEGEWMTRPEELEKIIRPYWDAGFDVYHHVTGDLGVEVCLDALSSLQTRQPRAEFRFDLQHFGVSREHQADRMRRLGATASGNGYYLYLLADKYAEYGLGAERADQMVRLGSLARNAVRFSLHSDLPMGPVRPLLAASTAATRLTSGGTVRGPGQAVPIEHALRAVTIDAAWMLHRDHEIGSIAAGKKADFTVLGSDPFAVTPAEVSDIPIRATVFEGQPHFIK